MYDTFLYNGLDGEETTYIDCDRQIVAKLLKHLKKYKLRLKLDVSEISGQVVVGPGLDSFESNQIIAGGILIQYIKQTYNG